MAEEQPREQVGETEGWPQEAIASEESSSFWPSSAEPVAPAGASAVIDAVAASALETDPVADQTLYEPELQLLRLHVPPPKPPERIPNFGHLLILCALGLFGVLFSSLLTQYALNKHMFGVTSLVQAETDIHFTLGSEALLYLFTLAAALFVFPMIWEKNLFAGLQWNFATAFRLRWRLISAALACLLLAAASSVIAPGPTNAPIDKIFRSPGAPWLLFFFGVTFAPFFEEMIFRGFLLPALCTVADWTYECLWRRPNSSLNRKFRLIVSIPAMILVCSTTVVTPVAIFYAFYHRSLPIFVAAVLVGPALYFGLRAIRPATADERIRRPDANGHPLWSNSALMVGAIVTSIPFAALHAAQTGYSIGPFMLLAGVSMVLCAVRLSTRSLAASTLVHACYNFTLFTIMVVGTHGFKHLSDM